MKREFVPQFGDNGLKPDQPCSSSRVGISRLCDLLILWLSVYRLLCFYPEHFQQRHSATRGRCCTGEARQSRVVEEPPSRLFTLFPLLFALRVKSNKRDERYIYIYIKKVPLFKSYYWKGQNNAKSHLLVACVALLPCAIAREQQVFSKRSLQKQGRPWRPGENRISIASE